MSDFDSYLKEFRKRSDGTDLDFWADVTYLTQSHPPPPVEKRFSCGFVSWLFWALREILASGRGTPPAQDPPAEKPVAGFRLLPTPAHHDSLAPLAAALAPAITFGHPLDDGVQRIHRPLGLPSSLAELSLARKLGALVAAARKAGMIVNILTRPAPLGPPLPAGFKSRIAEYILKAELELRRWRCFPPPIHSLFVSYEMIADTKGLIIWAREAGIRVFHVMHGQRLPTYQVTRATDVVLFSAIDEPWFRQRLPDDIRIQTVGHPRLETIRTTVPPPPPDADRRLPHISFFSQPSEMDYSREERLRDWSILAGLRGKAKVRFRLHPRESPASAMADLKQLGTDFVEISSAGLLNDLAWSDAVASSWSTVSMEAAACGRGIFWTCADPDRYEAPRELRSQGLGVLLRQPGDWQPYLDHWSAHGEWPSAVTLRESRLRELGMIGNAGQPWAERLELFPPP